MVKACNPRAWQLATAPGLAVADGRAIVLLIVLLDVLITVTTGEFVDVTLRT